MLNESYLQRFEQIGGLKKGTVSNTNPLFESYMMNNEEENQAPQVFLVVDGKIIGGFASKEEATSQQEDYAQQGVRASMFTSEYLSEKGIDVNDESHWGDASMGTGEPEQADVDAVQAQDAVDHDGVNEPENDKDAESQDDLHLGENEFKLNESQYNRFLKNAGILK